MSTFQLNYLQTSTTCLETFKLQPALRRQIKAAGFHHSTITWLDFSVRGKVESLTN